MDGSDSDNDQLSGPISQSSSVSQDIEWLGTVRGRIGLATGNWLLYATGGLAYAKVDYDYSYSLRPDIDYIANDSESSVETGWTLGGGAEVALGKWSLKGEYLYYDLGDQDLSAEGVLNGVRTSALGRPIHFEPEFETQGHIARIGLNYHFD
jgi:outer membrane immunogenic protein